MEIQSYKCPNCGGGLVFDPKTQKFKCEYCLSAFTEETLKEMEEAARKSEEASKPGGMPEAEKIESQKQAESKMVLYTCPSCGARSWHRRRRRPRTAVTATIRWFFREVWTVNTARTV